ncbi:hypothetical protein ACS0TY_025261 [Phlomoides rotata]
MGRWGLMMFVVSLMVANQVAAARVLPSDAGLTDQKNFLTFGGVGGYSGVGNNGMPVGGVFGGVGSNGLGGNGFQGAGGMIGTGPNGGLTGVYGTIPGGVTTVGPIGGGSGGILPNP